MLVGQGKVIYVMSSREIIQILKYVIYGAVIYLLFSKIPENSLERNELIAIVTIATTTYILMDKMCPLENINETFDIEIDNDNLVSQTNAEDNISIDGNTNINIQVDDIDNDEEEDEEQEEEEIIEVPKKKTRTKKKKVVMTTPVKEDSEVDSEEEDNSYLKKHYDLLRDELFQ